MTVPLPAAPGAPADAGTGGQAPTGTQPQPQGQAAGSGTQQQPADKTDLSTLPPDVRKIIEDTRAEAARHRTEKQTATAEAQAAKAQRDAVLKALGYTSDGKPAEPDATTLTARAEHAEAVAWSTAVKYNVHLLASDAGADATALIDSNAFVDSLDEIELADNNPDSPEFKQKLGAHIKAYIEKNPRFKANATTAAPPRAGGDRPAGGSGTQPQRPRGLGAAVRQHYGQRGG